MVEGLPTWLWSMIDEFDNKNQGGEIRWGL